MDLFSMPNVAYGIRLIYPQNWRYMSPPDRPLRYAVNKNKDIAIVAAVLPLDLVERGLRAISTYILDTIFKVRVSSVEVISNVEDQGKPRRTFKVALNTSGGKYIVEGIVELVFHGSGEKAYSEYFLKCISYKEGKNISSLIPLLDKIDKTDPGIPIGAPLKMFSWIWQTQPNKVSELATFFAPKPTIVAPMQDGVMGIIGPLTFSVKVFRMSQRLIDEYMVDGYLREALATMNIQCGEIQHTAGEKELTGRTVASGFTAETHVRWSNPIEDDEVVVSAFTFVYPKDAEYGARKIIIVILSTWRLTPDLFGMLFPLIPASIVTSIRPMSPPPKPRTYRPTPQSKSIKMSNSTKKGMDIEECKRKIRFLKMKIVDVKRRLRLLDYDYKTQKEVLEVGKTSDVITGMYTFVNPAGKTRYVYSRARSPIVGDRFWEHKNKVFMPENKAIFSTGKMFAPHPKHEFRELKWKRREDEKKLEAEYRHKRRELEEELRRLEEELRRYQSMCE